VGIAAEWARRGLLPGGDEIALCTFEVEPQNLLPQPGLVEIMPPLNTLMAEVDERVKDRLKIQKVAWQNTDTLRKVLKEHNIWVQDNE
jgi:cysteinyl-tRNA synthetase